jgi:26S proteasome regulatory subunit N12
MDRFLADYDGLAVEEATRRIQALLPLALSDLLALNVPSAPGSLPPSGTVYAFLELAAYHAARTLDGVRFGQMLRILLPFYLQHSPHYGAGTEKRREEGEKGKGEGKEEGADWTPRARLLVGLHLLDLLVRGQRTEFHRLVAQLPTLLTCKCPILSFPVQLERSLLEGTYARILTTGLEDLPAPEYGLFLQGALAERIRLDIAGTLHAAFESLSLGECRRLLLLPDDDHVSFQVLAQRLQWHVQAGLVYFRHPYHHRSSALKVADDSDNDENENEQQQSKVALLRAVLGHIQRMHSPVVSVSL